MSLLIYPKIAARRRASVSNRRGRCGRAAQRLQAVPWVPINMAAVWGGGVPERSVLPQTEAKSFDSLANVFVFLPNVTRVGGRLANVATASARV